MQNTHAPWTQNLPFFKRFDWAAVSIVTLTPLIALLATPLYLLENGIHWNLFGFFVFYCVITSISITGGYHRMFAHKAYEGNRLLKFLYLIFGAAAFQGSVLRWASNHRRHHKFVDTDDDPYSIKKGFFFAHVGCVFYRENPKYKNVLIPDLLKDRLVIWQHERYIPIATFMGFGVPFLVGWAMNAPFGGLLIAGVVRIVFTHHCTFLINSLCHMFGRQPYSDTHSGRDSMVMALLTYGEGYHNYHHQFQYDYRNGIKWWHWDPTKWSIIAMSYLGLTRNLRRAEEEEIARALVRKGEKELVERGVPAHQLTPIRHRIEETGEKIRMLRQQLREAAGKRFDHVRDQYNAELRAAQIEFRMAFARWSAETKSLK